MIFLGVPTGYYDYMIVSALATALTVILLLAGIAYLYRSRVLKKGSAIPIVMGLLIIVMPILIWIGFPYMLGGWNGGYANTTIFGIVYIIILIVAFAILVYLIRSKKKILKEAGAETEEGPEMARITTESGLKLGSAILIIGSLWIIVSNFLGGFYYFYYSAGFEVTIINIVLGFCILISSLYNQIRKKFSIFGYLFCLIGSVSLISLNLLIAIDYSVYYLLYEGIIPLIVGTLSIIGLVINSRGNIRGSQMCMVLGLLALILNFPLGLFIYYFASRGFLILYYTIQFEPFLILIGGYFLYQEHLKT
jgi:hypothetical protein